MSRIPTDTRVVSRKTQTIQTHNNVNVGANAWAVGTWLNCDGFDQIAINLKNDAGTANAVNIDWSMDGVNQHGGETLLSSAPNSMRAASTSVKASYARVAIQNGDAAAHNISAWVYLKA